MAEETAVPEAPTASTDDGKTFTQADVDRVVSERLAREREKYKDVPELRKAADRLKEIEEANASELEKAKKAAEKAQQQAAESATKLLRYEIAQEKEVPAKLVPLLTATDKESLEAQATLLLENVKPETPDFNGGARQPAPDPKTPEEQHNAALLGMLGITPNT